MSVQITIASECQSQLLEKLGDGQQAWSNANLTRLAEKICSPLVLWVLAPPLRMC